MSTLGNITQITNDVTALAVIAAIGIGGYYLFKEIEKLQPKKAYDAGGGDEINEGKDCKEGYMTKVKTEGNKGRCNNFAKGIGACYEGEGVKDGLWCRPWAEAINLCESATAPTYECAPIKVDQQGNPQLEETKPKRTLSLGSKCNKTSECSRNELSGGPKADGTNIYCNENNYCSRVTEQIRLTRQSQTEKELGEKETLLIPVDESPTGREIRLPPPVDPSLGRYSYGPEF